MRDAIAIGWVVAACSLSAGCLDGLAPSVGDAIVGRCDPEDSNPELDISFNVDVLPLFLRSPREGGCGCHNSSAGSSGYRLSNLDLRSYERVMQGGLISGDNHVVAGNPCMSILYLKLTSAPPFGSRMPNSGPPFFTREELALVHDWIAEGALDD